MILRDVPILDLRGIDVERIAQIDRIENVRTVVLDPINAEAFMRVSRAEVRSHVIVRPDEVLCTGQIEVDDGYLSSLPDQTSCVLLGQALIDGFTPTLFFQKLARLRIFGQVLYSHRPSAGAVLSRAERLQGQLLAMAPNARRWIGETHLDRALLQDLAGEPVVSIGPITLDPGLTAADITAGIPSMTQIGEIKGSDELVCALMARCTVRLGTYSLSEEQTPPPATRMLHVVPA